MTRHPHSAHSAHAERHPYAWQLHENRNVGGWERAARLFVGAALFSIAFTAGPVWVRVLLAIAGIMGMTTSIAAYCPLNRAAGRDSYHHGILH